jgi:hypothetical protein
MSDLLAPDTGRLVCLEWPLGKPASTGGPPWGLTGETYAAHLSRPGEDVGYDDQGKPVVAEEGDATGGGGLRRLARFQPRRTHKAGYADDGSVVDYISVWGH